MPLILTTTKRPSQQEKEGQRVRVPEDQRQQSVDPTRGQPPWYLSRTVSQAPKNHPNPSIAMQGQHLPPQAPQAPHPKTVRQHLPLTEVDTHTLQNHNLSSPVPRRPPDTCSPRDHPYPSARQTGKRDYSHPLSNGIDKWGPVRDKFIQLVFWRGRHSLKTNVIKKYISILTDT